MRLSSGELATPGSCRTAAYGQVSDMAASAGHDKLTGHLYLLASSSTEGMSLTYRRRNQILADHREALCWS